jgi:hypothetical protein
MSENEALKKILGPMGDERPKKKKAGKYSFCSLFNIVKVIR